MTIYPRQISLTQESPIPDSNSPDLMSTFRNAASLDDFYKALTPMDMTPGWIDRNRPILWFEPHTAFTPAHWRYEESRQALDVAGRLISTELSERRNLIAFIILLAILILLKVEIISIVALVAAGVYLAYHHLIAPKLAAGALPSKTSENPM